MADLSRLIDRWCERRQLIALAHILPAMHGLTVGVSRSEAILVALRTIERSVRLPAIEAQTVQLLIEAAGDDVFGHVASFEVSPLR